MTQMQRVAHLCPPPTIANAISAGVREVFAVMNCCFFVTIFKIADSVQTKSKQTIKHGGCEVRFSVVLKGGRAHPQEASHRHAPLRNALFIDGANKLIT